MVDKGILEADKLVSIIFKAVNMLKIKPVKGIEMDIFVRIESKESFDKWQMSKSCFMEKIYNYAQSLIPFVNE